MAKSANAYVKIIVSSNIKQAMSDFKAAHPTLSKFGGMIKKVGLIGAAAFAVMPVKRCTFTSPSMYSSYSRRQAVSAFFMM